jgi:hypothetical protein
VEERKRRREERRIARAERKKAEPLAEAEKGMGFFSKFFG